MPMPEQKHRTTLPQQTHSVRTAQAVLQYGVGAMVDFPDQTLVTAAPELWSRTQRIYDERLAKALHVSHFARPTEISYTRFPSWYFCPKCRHFQPLRQWIAHYRKTAAPKQLETDPYMVRHPRCPICRQDLLCTRIVTVCQNGHLSDFPWVKWVHAKSKRPICGTPSLRLKTGASGSEGLDGIQISCACGAHATLKGAMDNGRFQALERDSKDYTFRCDGTHPFRHETEACSCYPRAVQRGSSAVYFPLVYRSLVIPPYADRLNKEIEESSAFEICMGSIENEDPEDRPDFIQKRLPKWAKKIALEISADEQDVAQILQRKWHPTQEQDGIGTAYRHEEFAALSGAIGAHTSARAGDFSRVETDIAAYGIPHIRAVSLIDKIRMVHALLGFSRIQPVTSPAAPGFVSVKQPQTNWYPAYEVRGEGIFIELAADAVNHWLQDYKEQLYHRVEILRANAEDSLLAPGLAEHMHPAFIMLHTLSHLLITQLSFACGYSVASLSERIYCADAQDAEMYGIFIYTASGDAEGTLGGLVRQGRADTFPQILRSAVAHARTCSNDPVCIMSHGQGRDSLNLAACHSCALLPETCCEHNNILLDRGMIVGTYDHPELGFWKDLCSCVNKSEADF